MKVAKLYRLNDIRIEEVPVPAIGPRDALVKTKACGICSGDVMPWYIEKKAPLVPGHEPVGEIVELGSEFLRTQNSELKTQNFPCSPPVPPIPHSTFII